MRLLFKTRSFLKRFLPNDHTEMTENVNEKENFEKGLKLETSKIVVFNVHDIPGGRVKTETSFSIGIGGKRADN